MSTVSKQSSKKETKKEIKKEPVIDSEMEHSENENENENDKHSIFNGDFKKNPSEAKYFLKHFNAIKEEFYDSDSEAQVLKFAWGESYESLVELVKKNNKKEKTMKAKFIPKDITKPKKPIDLFGEKFSKDSKEKGVKFNKDNNYLVCRKKAWDSLSTKEQDKYTKQSQKDQEAFDIEFAKQKADAIKNGEFPEDKIKGPCTAYFLFLADIRPKLTEKFKDDSDKNTKITKEAANLWKELSDKEKEKYMKVYKAKKAEYDVKQQKWKTNEVERIKKQTGSNIPVDVKVESSGKKKNDKTHVVHDSDNTDSEEVEVKSKKAKAKTSDKKAIKVEEIIQEDEEVPDEIDEEEDEEDEEVEEVEEVVEVIVEKPKANTSNTSKSSKATKSK